MNVTLSKSQRAYDYLLERISGGEVGSGERLVLGKIAEALNMSPVPVREAIRRLEAEGLVSFHQNVGATVAGIDPERYLHTMQTLGVVEAAATALSAPLLSPEDLTKAQQINEKMRSCLEHFDPRTFTLLNAEFHAALSVRCPNPHLSDLVARGWARLERLRTSTFVHVPQRAKISVQEHDDLLKLCAQGASYERIEQAARTHRWNTLAAFQDSLSHPTSQKARS